ncbi:MAG: glycosyl transferase [Helicobacteraceae bacterium 4484_230]|nr:MAG: glycosyl transferase [Helicobacteraceae bacterium 4484_230]
MSKSISTVHITSAHPRYDTRIFVKECSSLAKEYELSLIVADGLGDETKNGVRIIDAGKPAGRMERMFKTVNAVYKKAVALDADIYHLHDPELLRIGLKLKRAGKKVIFDAHEDLPVQIRNKTYLRPCVRKAAALFFQHYEAYACSRFDAVVAATPFIRDKFLAINMQTEDINNYPILDELGNTVAYRERDDTVCYVGYITEVRGIKELVRAMESVEGCRLTLAGKFQEPEVEKEVRGYRGWEKVDFPGFLDRNGIRDLLSRSRAGLVTLHPTPNYLDALPVKMFEYMAAGVPVIASDFPLWRSIIDDAGCGICVDPESPESVAKAINRLLADPEKAEKMGDSGRKAAREKYNWGMEEQKLLDLYSLLLRKQESGI